MELFELGEDKLATLNKAWISTVLEFKELIKRMANTLKFDLFLSGLKRLFIIGLSKDVLNIKMKIFRNIRNEIF